MNIVIGSDHGGAELKNQLVELLKKDGHNVSDQGGDPAVRVDYPLQAAQVCRTYLSGEFDCGIICCGTGIGVSIAANKIDGIRAALCTDCYSAAKAKEHNNANIITLGGRTLGIELAYAIVQSYLNAHFEGERHQRRVDQIMALEKDGTHAG